MYFLRPEDDPEVSDKVKVLRKITTEGHAGETEVSTMYVHRPDLVHPERAHEPVSYTHLRAHET